MPTIGPPPIKFKLDTPERVGISKPWREWFASLYLNVSESPTIVPSANAGDIALFTTTGDLQSAGVGLDKYLSSTFTTNIINLTTSYLGRVIKINNGANNVVCVLPSVGADQIDSWITFIRLGTGKVKIQAADADVIESSSEGGGIVCDEPGRVLANVKLFLASETKWAILAGTGIWQVV